MEHIVGVRMEYMKLISRQKNERNETKYPYKWLPMRVRRTKGNEHENVWRKRGKSELRARDEIEIDK